MAELAPRGITVRDVAPSAFIAAYALHLKNSDKFEVRSPSSLACSSFQSRSITAAILLAVLGSSHSARIA